MAATAIMEKHGVIIATTAAATFVTGMGIYYYLQKKKNDKVTKKTRKIMQAFDIDNCYVKDPAILFGKLKKLVEGGASKLQIVTDFDRTLTKSKVDGLHGHSSYGVLEESSYIPSSSVEELSTLKAKYFPIEMDTSISEEDKIPLMIEWFTAAFKVAVNSEIKRSCIAPMVSESRCYLRDGVEEFMFYVKLFDVPLLIISAGVGDIIDEVFHQQCDLPAHVKVVANYYTYDEKDVVNGFKGSLIHTYNKGKISVIEKKYFDQHKRRSNILLFGDTLGDLAMADGMEGSNNIITIGFLNDRVEESLDAYMTGYDIVLTNDATMDLIDYLILTFCRED